MPWRDLSSSAQRVQLLALPTTLREFEELYTLTPADLEIVAARRTATNRLGVAVQLCFLRHPGRAWTSEEVVPLGMLRFIASQVGARTDDFAAYGDRDETRREHLTELVHEFGFATFGVGDYRTFSSWLRDRTHENQRHRACGLNLIVAAIVLWNTVYLERAVAALREIGQTVSEEALAHLSPLKWDHINLTGDYHWPKDAGRRRRLRLLGMVPPAVPTGP